MQITSEKHPDEHREMQEKRTEMETTARKIKYTFAEKKNAGNREKMHCATMHSIHTIEPGDF